VGRQGREEALERRTVEPGAGGIIRVGDEHDARIRAHQRGHGGQVMAEGWA
jgi:hypothetical protein